MISPRRRAPRKWNWTIQLVKDWEAAFFSGETPRTRKIALRTSLVFSPVPGSIFAVLSLVRFGLGGRRATAANMSHGFTNPILPALSNS